MKKQLKALKSVPKQVILPDGRYCKGGKFYESPEITSTNCATSSHK
jgi:hypothetical protein